ncbi:MAG: hypothetical protein Alis3KO_29000 [Aliiglaciecola sp.]
MSESEFPDAFAQARKYIGVEKMDDQNDPVQMVLRFQDVRKCAHNWKSFQSGAEPGRIVVPSEVAIRSIRQIPFEVDPPAHKGYRTLVEPWFKRPLKAEYTNKLKHIVDDALDEAFSVPEFDVVTDFALPIQSKALAVLLNTPSKEAETWISWGTHVFRSEGEALDGDKANLLYGYLDSEIERASNEPVDDLYSLLLSAEVNGKKMTREEVKGVMILTFAGGRDTVINAITNIVAYFAEHVEELKKLKGDEPAIKKAVEELVRYFSPLTHMGRVATEDKVVCQHTVKSDTRISLCWASANRDEQVFENPNNVILDRKNNPHVAFGFGVHNCLGSTHARQLLRALIAAMAERVDNIQLLNANINLEQWGSVTRKVGFHQLTACFLGS